MAIKIYYSGVSGRGVGNIMGFSKANVYNWIKKTVLVVDNSPEIFELDELYWFIDKKAKTKIRENAYVITMVSREPRQIAGFSAEFDKSPERVQHLVDGTPESKKYCTDGWTGYVDVIYPGKHIRNTRDKSDTFTVEGVNADLRHYIPGLARRSRCFYRKLDTLQMVLAVFAVAYNKFGVAKMRYRALHEKGEFPFGLVSFI